MSPLRASRERLILREIAAPLAAGGALLDVGCGDGHLLDLVRSRYPGVSLRGIDFSREARDRAPEALRERIVVGDIAELSGAFGGERFDVIVCSEVLEHVAEPAAVLRSIASVLRPGGTVVITVPGAMRYWSGLDESAGHCRRFEFEEVAPLLASAGLEVERVFGWGTLVGRIYYRLVRTIGAGGVSSAAQTRLAGIIGRVAAEAMRVDDHLPRRRGFQLVARARGR